MKSTYSSPFGVAAAVELQKTKAAVTPKGLEYVDFTLTAGVIYGPKPGAPVGSAAAAAPAPAPAPAGGAAKAR